MNNCSLKDYKIPEQIPRETLIKLLKSDLVQVSSLDWDSLGCLLALLDPNVSPDILEQNADSLLWSERYIIAIHPKTPQQTIQRLSNDGNVYVRAAASESLL